MSVTCTSAQYADLQCIDHPAFDRAGISCSVLRLDTFSSFADGNKFFKLKLNIVQAKQSGFDQILSFGGAYSNHIHALALAGKHFGMSTVGVIRGDELEKKNSTLRDAEAAGMTLEFVSRQDYRRRNEADFLDGIKRKYPNCFVIPEGGSNLLGAQGCMEIIEHIYHHDSGSVDLIVLPCGTAATLAGIAASCNAGEQVLGFSVLKNAQYLEQDASRVISGLVSADKDNWKILHGYHCGGYARLSAELVSFIDSFEQRYHIPIEPVYSGKMFFGFFQMLQDSPQLVAPGSRVVFIHTGGLQGRRGMEAQMQKQRMKKPYL